MTPLILLGLCAILFGRTDHGDSTVNRLPDFQLAHKYRIDASKKDAAANAARDGDRQQRREFTYSVRAVIRLMPPYNLDALNDDYQDVRVVSQTKDYAEVEVMLYPLNTNADAIESNANWKSDDASMKEYLDPGITTNWDERMQKDLLAELARAGIHPDRLTDRQVVEQVSRWLYGRSQYTAMFCTHYVGFPQGKPAVYPGLERAFERDKGSHDWSLEQQFDHELLGKQMFYHRTHGSCTSSAVYQATVLRALGIPTRMIVVIPIVDPSDPAQVEMVRTKLRHYQVRHMATLGVTAAGNNYTNHTFLEVYVGRRWRRLNYTKLGQNILDPKYLGLMVHVHTFNDLSEANIAPTWGARYALARKDSEFAHSNPYRTVDLSDHFGSYAQVPNPPAHEHTHLTITRAYWADSSEAREDMRQSAARHSAADGAIRLFIHGDEWFNDAGDSLQYREFLQRVDRKLLFRAKGQPDVRGDVKFSFFMSASAGLREVEVAIPKQEYAKMAGDVPYTIEPANAVPGYEWKVKQGLTITRPLSVEEKLEKVLDRLDRMERRLDAVEKRLGSTRQ
jgi:hypothetical protein